ncbi:MAG TPA: efflux RND transporter permease subunit [Acidobacteriota bacterium]|nr:efflux RND transporter permease subunit [Acidobacteriota bacterium]
MLERIIDWSLENRFLVILGTPAALVWGLYSVQNAPLDAIPDLSDVQVTIYTQYPGPCPLTRSGSWVAITWTSTSAEKPWVATA